MKAMLVVSGLLVAPPLSAQPPSLTFPREHPADAARRELDRRFQAEQAEMGRLRDAPRRDVERQRDLRTPEGPRPSPPPFPPPGPR